MVARLSTTSKCREKTKELILLKEPKEMPPPYVLLYPPLPQAASSAPLPLTSERESRGTVTPVKSGVEASGGSNPLTSLSPMDHIPIPSPPVLILNPPFNWEHLTSCHEDPSSPQTPTALQMSLREVQVPKYYDEYSQIQEGGQIFVYHHRPLKLETSYPLLHGKLQALIDLMQSIIHTYIPGQTVDSFF
jgi:hypothetical protein